MAIGQPAPAFKLKDQDGKEVSLDALLKKGPVVLVFYRSAEWCLACQLQLVKLQRHLKKFEAAGGHVVGISYDSAPTLKAFADRKRITLPLLSDPGSKTIEAYAVRDKQAARDKDGAANHATFVVDQQGIVRAKLLQVIYDERPAVDSLVNALKAARNPGEGAKP